MKILMAEYFTDPLCSWSWGHEPYYQKMREEFGQQIHWRHRMGGMVESFDACFHDPQYSLSGEDYVGLAQHQSEVSQSTGMPIDTGFWFEAPPKSSFPFCIAVKAAGMQGFTSEDLFLRRIREALLTEKRLLNSFDSLLELAEEVQEIDIDKLSVDIESETVYKSFRKDWAKARHPVVEAKDTKLSNGTLRYSFPTLLLYDMSGYYKVLDGGDSYEKYQKAIMDLAPTIKRMALPDINGFLKNRQRFSTMEVSVVCEMELDDAETALNGLVSKKILSKRSVGQFAMWEKL